MIPDNRRDKINSNRAIKAAISAIPIAGVVFAISLLLSGLSTVGSYHSVFAQQNMTQGGGNATGAAGGNQSEVMMHLEEARTALQINDVQGAMMHLDLAMNLLGGGGTQANMTSTAGSTNSTG
jgi:hypothetical protein